MQIVMHEKCNCITCECGEDVYENHQCKITDNDKIIKIDICDVETCEICIQQAENEKFYRERWREDDDGYMRCGNCQLNYVKISVGCVFVKDVIKEMIIQKKNYAENV